MPNSVVHIGEGIFAWCENLYTVVLSESLESLPMFTFENCETIEEIVIPASVKTIADNAISYCLNLVSVTFMSTDPPATAPYSIVTYNNPDNVTDVTIHVPVGCEDAYSGDELWQHFPNIVGDVNVSTAISSAISGQRTSTATYSLSGMRLPVLRKGINIINGKKYLNR